jgi:hypothetical protein
MIYYGMTIKPIKMECENKKNIIPHDVLLEAMGEINECREKTGLTTEQILLYLSGKVDKQEFLLYFCDGD